MGLIDGWAALQTLNDINKYKKRLFFVWPRYGDGNDVIIDGHADDALSGENGDDLVLRYIKWVN